MIECSKCGSENRFDGAAFCKQCGAQLSTKVAVEVVRESVQLNQTDKIYLNTKPAQPSTDIVSDDFTVEDISGREESVEDLKKLETSTPEGGIDKLLSLYGNDSSVEQAQSSIGEDFAETNSLGVESASDYLLREQACGGPLESPTSAKLDQEIINPPDKLAKIQAKLTPIEDKEPEIKNPMGSPKPRALASAMAVDEKNRLLDSLNRSLHSETLLAASHREQANHVEDSIAKSSFQESQLSAKMATESTAALSSDIMSPAADPEPIAPATPVVNIRGRILTFPNNVRVLPGDCVVHNDHTYLVRRGAADKRSWTLAGILAAVLVTVIIVHNLTAPAPLKATLFGVVANSETNEALAGISVSIPQLNVSTVTDEHGMFKFAGVADGRYDVKIEGGLYEARFFPVIVKNNQSEMVYGSVNPILPRTSAVSVPARAVAVKSTPTEEQPEYGTLKINCNVADAVVMLDGKSLGKVSQVFKRLNPGARNIAIRADGYQEIAQIVNVIGGQSVELTANLLASSDDTPVEYTADDFFEQAETLYREQKNIEAVGYYTLALAKNGAMVKAYLRRAEAHLQVGKKLNARADYRSAADLYINSAMYAQAIACYDKILEFQPDASDAYSLRGWAKISIGDYDNGLRDLQQALSFTPEDQQAQFDVGKALYVTNRYKDAEKILKKIRKHGDEYPEIYGYLALTELAQGDESAARKAYDAFRKVATSAQLARISTQSGWQRLTALAGN